MTSVQKSLKKLREIAPDLNKATDDAAKIVQEVETLLAKLSIGITAEVRLYERQKTKSVSEYTSLAYCRVKGNFRIAVTVEKSTDFVDDRGCAARAWDTVSETPWAECQREAKLESFPKLPDLLEAIIKAAEEAKGKVDAAKQAVEKILSETE
jgi:hypothetical protein